MNNYLEHNNLKNLKEDKEIERKIQLILRVGKVLMESGADVYECQDEKETGFYDHSDD